MSLSPTWNTDDAEVRWLMQVTALPTASGNERHVIDWISAWTAARPDLRQYRDHAGNLILERTTPPDQSSRRPLYITAHLDHPAFVIERVVGERVLEASFRGGVNEPYFANARLRVFSVDATQRLGTIVKHERGEPFPTCTLHLDEPCTTIRTGDIARWDLPDPAIDGDLIHTHACDDLSAVAAALAALERLRSRPDAAHVRLLFTRAEEIGFIGAIAACKLGTIDTNARVIALENSRSFAESPIGAGPIVRVGDRISVFHPGLTAAVGKVAEKLAEARPDRAGASPRPFKWQRKLMPGGACEASAYQCYGYESTCVCLPLGNYHNMADLDRVGAGDPEAVRSARVAREFISVADYKGMIDLLVACGTRLAAAEPLVDRLEKLYADKAFVLEEGAAGPAGKGTRP